MRNPQTQSHWTATPIPDADLAFLLRLLFAEPSTAEAMAA